MRRFLRALLLLIVGLLALVLLGPFLIPVPPLENTVPARELADPDSLFIEINGLNVHYKRSGSGEPVFLLLHGFAGSTFNWREVMGPLAELGTAIAFDRPAFGLTESPLTGEWESHNPYTRQAQIGLTLGLLDALGYDQAILIGNSAGGTLATEIALTHPDRVQGLVLADPAIYSGGGAPAFIRPFLNTPQLRRIGPLVARNLLGQSERLIELAWHDPSKLSPEARAGYERRARVQDWDKALWTFTLASDEADFTGRLETLRLPTLVITGDDDRIVPTEETIRLADELPNATLVVIPDCGHVPMEECPEAFMDAVTTYARSLVPGR
jgi:pimeloyl-ACP methyl ester carboxylesterase